MTLRDMIDMLLLAALWGMSFLFMRIAGPEFGAVALVGVRVAVAALFLLPILLLRGDLAELRANWGRTAVLGAFNSALPFILFVYSTFYITGGFSAILNATAPLWAALIAWIWLSDRLTASQGTGLVVGFAGVYLLVWDKVSFTISGTLLAILAAIIASASYGFAANMAIRYARDVKPLVLATGSQLAATVLVLPGALLTWPDAPVSPPAWAAALSMGVGSTGLAYILYFRLIANIGASRAIAVTYLVPAFAMFFGAVFINEIVTLTMLVGCAIILLGTSLATGMLTLTRSRL